ncbi:hypothetical protein C1645_823037 [Glomus cerebriforme]|uniref:Uncharacterized protein n=1 Tax=Glomus cerebriforme TaxID=658196 RepID=A0A397T328_9GLOM|nr:hypothetical protein C1645_823037 [Glomus cerebriforme]
MRKAIDINNMRSIHEIVKDILRKAQNKKWNFNEFIVMGTWKSEKKNLCNNRFMEHMRERNERIPDFGKYFSYIVVKGPRLHNEKGITIAMYTRFINEDDRYQPSPLHKIMQLKNSDKREKQIDEYFQDEAHFLAMIYIIAISTRVNIEYINIDDIKELVIIEIVAGGDEESTSLCEAPLSSFFNVNWSLKDLFSSINFNHSEEQISIFCLNMLFEDSIPFSIYSIVYFFELSSLFAHSSSSLKELISLGSSITDVFIWAGSSSSPPLHPNHDIYA